MKHRPHKWWTCPWRGMQWLTFCLRCGLIPLKNARTLAAIRAGCPEE